MTRGQFATLPVLGAVLATAEPPAAGGAPAYVFAREDFVRRATLPYRHRQMFAARGLGSGVVLHLMTNSLKAYNSPGGFGDGPDSLHAAAVLYGTALTALLSDAAWNDLQLAQFLQRLGDLPAGSPSGNPYNAVVTELMRSHASFFVCNNALHDVAQALANASASGNQNEADVYAVLRRGIKPQALVVPAGVAALNALAENHFTLVQATV